MILSGALPRNLADLLAILTLDLVAAQLVLSHPIYLELQNASMILIFLVPMISALAALSNSPIREREELALVAYGGSSRYIELRYVLRGSIIVAVGLLPMIAMFLTGAISSPWGPVLLALLIFLGGLTYSIPALKRIRSLIFVEQYKG